MRKTQTLFLVVSVTFLSMANAREEPLRLAQTITLGRVEGRIDHFAVDVQGQRLFVSALGNNTVVGDADDLFFDAARHRIYISGGEGFFSVVEQRNPNHYEDVARVPTAAGARTSFFVPELGRLYLAVPHRGSQGAEIRVYKTSR
jgi:hypothetical protein